MKIHRCTREDSQDTLHAKAYEGICKVVGADEVICLQNGDLAAVKYRKARHGKQCYANMSWFWRTSLGAAASDEPVRAGVKKAAFDELSKEDKAKLVIKQLAKACQTSDVAAAGRVLKKGTTAEMFAMMADLQVDDGQQDERNA